MRLMISTVVLFIDRLDPDAGKRTLLRYGNHCSPVRIPP
jgi:hypothetical protein